MRRFSMQSQRVSFLFLATVLTMVLALPAGAAGPVGPAAAGSPVRILRSDATGATLELAAPAFTLSSRAEQGATSEAACQELIVAGMGQTAEPGRPQLPVTTVLLGAPAAAELRLEVQTAEQRTVGGVSAICAAPRVQQDDDAPAADGSAAQADRADPAVYGANAFYPTEPVRVVDLGYMRTQRIVRVEFYPFQVNPVTGEVRAADQLRATVHFDGATGEPAVEPADWEQSFRDTLANYDVAAQLRADRTNAAPSTGWAPPQPGYKIAVKDEGIYHLTRPWLAAGGVPVDSLDPRTFRLFNGKAEVAIRVTGEADGRFDPEDEVVFYGRGVDTRYTDTNIYWLSYGGGQGARMTSRASTSGGVPVASYLTTVKKEDNTTYDSNLPMLSGYDHWFGQQIQAVGAGKSGSTSATLVTPQLAQGAANATVTVMLGAVTTGSHHVRLYVNATSYPTYVYDGNWDGATVFQATAELPQSHLNASGNNTVKVEIINDFAGRAADIIRLDWVRLDYQRALVADGDKLLFGGDAVQPSASGTRRFSVNGYSTANVDAYDITDPAHVALITGVTVGPPSNGVKLFLPLIVKGSKASATQANAGTFGAAAPAALTLQFGDNLPSRRYAGWDRAQLLTPLSISLDQPSNLQAASNGADYLIVTHSDFVTAVQPLANLRRMQGMRVQVVDVQDVYDEFGGGLMSAEAIRDFVAYAYASWTKPAPSYLLLVGDGTYDFRNYKSTDKTFVPPYLEMVDPDAGETATDNRFVAVTPGDILPDLHVGRLPANTAGEATIMVNKILGYEAQPHPWTKQVLFVADDLEGGGGDFYAYSDGIADGTALYNGSQVKILPADYTANKIYLGKTCDLSNPNPSVECRAQIIDKMNSGSLMVSYIGHGVKTYWAAERLYDANSLAGLANPGRLPVMLPMTCNEGYFIDPGEPSLSELSVRMDNRGVIASWSPTGFGLAPGHDYLQRGLFLSVFQENKPLGSAASAAKLYLVANAAPNTYRDLIDTFLLLGDPALHVK